MIFTLEALQARHGDCLILHYGPDDRPRFIVIDGGPDTVYEEALRPRLDQLRARWAPGDPLPLQMVMVSHIDDDHINGLLALARDLDQRREDREPLPYKVLTLWFNSFDDILGNGDQEIFSAVSDAAMASAAAGDLPAGASIDPHTAAVVASVPQGRELRQRAEALNIPLNTRFNGLVMRAGHGAPPSLDWGAGLTLRVLNPDEARVKKLHAKWEAALKDAKGRGDPKVLAAAYSDNSVFNLSSIAVLAEAGGKRILLTGDGRGDHILEGLRAAGLVGGSGGGGGGGGRVHVDVLKMPHHGSIRDVDRDFFELITPDHYVISADGRDDNPDTATLDMIFDVRGEADYRIHLTNRQGRQGLGERLSKLFAARPKLAAKVSFRDDDALSLRVDLLAPVRY